MPMLSLARVLSAVVSFGSAAVLLVLTAHADGEAKGSSNIVRQVDANTLQIGQVRVETKERRLTIPASVNMVEGPVEYLLVSALGKLHESIFKTEAEPIHIQTAAMLFLRESRVTNTPSVRVSLRWAGKELPVESVVENTSPANRLKPGGWQYNGSRLVEGTFIAQRDGSIISIIADPDAIFESGRVQAEDDENWRPSKEELPPVGTPVTLVLTFGSAAKPEKR